ncbi:hypothetical protein JW707_04740 [Candidatus Woesearchaeota archaeon]|nr:hypothetical protein [Candidatus Woesearchaeota archaeon]
MSETMESSGTSCAPLIQEVYGWVKHGSISFSSQDAKTFMSYKGTIDEVAETLKTALAVDSDESQMDLFLFSNRLLSGIIDYAIEQDTDLLELKHNAERFGISVFQGRYREAEEILLSMDLGGDIKNGEVTEKPDTISWASFNPLFVENLIYKLDDDNVPIDYIVLDGHDAYRPGFAVAAHFDTGVCAIRNGQDSKRDDEPRLIKGEKQYLKDILHNRNVLVLGEDVSTGRALASLVELVECLVPTKRITTAASVVLMDHPEGIPQYFGEESNTF